MAPVHRRHHSLGRPSLWALAVAALLVGLLLGLVWAGAGAAATEPDASASTGTGLWSLVELSTADPSV